MTSRERVLAAIEGRAVDVIPVCPYFWGAEYSWKLTGKPLWEILHGPGDTGFEVLEALDDRHGFDWLLPMHSSSGMLVGKSYSGQDLAHVYFADDSTGEEWVFHREGHWFTPAAEIGEVRMDNEGAGVEPPRTKAEADAWLRERHPDVDDPPKPHVPDLRLRERFPDRFLAGGMLPPFADLAYRLGFEPTMLMLSENPSLCAYMIERRLAHTAHQAQALADNGFDAGLMVDSFASADIMSPDTYANWIAPLHKLVSDELHAAGLKSVMYNTGNILPLLGSVRGMGYDVITFEERIKGVEMDVAEVRQALGPDICIFGNFDAYLLERGDHESISTEIARQIRAAGPRSFGMGTGSPVCDGTQPDTLDYWKQETWRISRQLCSGD